MNSDILAGKWKQFVGKAKARWGELTDDDWTAVDGKTEALIGKLQARYGWARERAHQEIDRVLKAPEATS
jgi:uncharacterized protein YjbJ (UPF0337 family)